MDQAGRHHRVNHGSHGPAVAHLAHDRKVIADDVVADQEVSFLKQSVAVFQSVRTEVEGLVGL